VRIVHFNEHLNWTGGVETYLLHLLPALESQGMTNTYVFARGDNNLLPRTVQLPEICQIGRRAEHNGYKKTLAILEDLRPEIIHIHRIYNLGVMRACLDFGPTVVTCHDYLYLCPAGSFFHRRTRTVCQRKAGLGCLVVTLLRHCMTLRPRYAVGYLRRVKQFHAWRDRFAFVLCPSDSVRDRLLKQDFPSPRTVTLPYFCPIKPRSAPRPLLGQPSVLFMGRIRPIKGFDVFIRALGLVPNAKGIIVGDANENTQKVVRKIAREAGCEHRLEIRPWAARDEIPSLFEQATLFVFPSIWPETLGIVGLEAMAHGVPVVASAIGGVRQWLRHGINGLLVPPKNVEALAAAIRDLLASPARLMEMGRAGIETIHQSFLIQDHVTRLLRLYHAAVGFWKKDLITPANYTGYDHK
jgi:glycosyltransferase involved in cell wall biosynthesis